MTTGRSRGSSKSMKRLEEIVQEPVTAAPKTIMRAQNTKPQKKTGKRQQLQNQSQSTTPSQHLRSAASPTAGAPRTGAMMDPDENGSEELEAVPSDMFDDNSQSPVTSGLGWAGAAAAGTALFAVRV